MRFTVPSDYYMKLQEETALRYSDIETGVATFSNCAEHGYLRFRQRYAEIIQ